jgi:imidazoleglycerol phosphate dehydratase HisB
VPAERVADGHGKGSYPLNSMMTPLNHLLEALSAYGPDNANVSAFVKVTSIIGSHHAVEEFLACGLWPLSE